MMISENTKLPLKLVIALLVGAAGLVSAGAIAQFRINDTAEKVDTFEEIIRRVERKSQRTEDSLGDIRDTLKEIKDDVKELRRR